MQHKNQNHRPPRTKLAAKADATPDQINSVAVHRPVLLEFVLGLLQPKAGERYLDLTVGYGGHAAAVLERTGPGSDHVLIERDPIAAAVLAQRFRGTGVTIMNRDFAGALEELEGPFDLVLADLGISSPQLDNPERGFSFREAGPLDMRMDPSQSATAADIINMVSERELADLIYRYGEERQSRAIARAIVAQRPVADTARLSTIIARAYRGRSHIHPATRTFQALRIAVNDELGQLERGLPGIEALLGNGGRLGIISFHSLEDRLVKRFIKTAATLTPLNKKVIMGKIEDVSNPRARSAKLRGAIKNTNRSISSSRGKNKNSS